MKKTAKTALELAIDAAGGPAALARAVCAELAAGRHPLAIEAWKAMRAEIFDRSPGQVARMDRRILARRQGASGT